MASDSPGSVVYLASYTSRLARVALVKSREKQKEHTLAWNM